MPAVGSATTSLTWRPLRALEGHQGHVRALAAVPGGSLVCSGSEDRTVRVWDLEEAGPGRVLDGHESWVNAVAVSPDGRVVASVSDDRTLRLWDLATGAVRWTVRGSASACSVCFHPQGTTLAAGFLDGQVVIYDLGGAVVGRLQPAREAVRAVSYAPDGASLACGTWASSRVHVVRLPDLGVVHSLDAGGGGIRALAWPRRGGMLCAASTRGGVRLWHGARFEHTLSVPGQRGKVMSMCLSPGDELLVCGFDSGLVRLLGTSPPQQLAQLQVTEGEVLGVAVAGAGRWLVAAGQDPRLMVSVATS